MVFSSRTNHIEVIVVMVSMLACYHVGASDLDLQADEGLIIMGLEADCVRSLTFRNLEIEDQEFDVEPHWLGKPRLEKAKQGTYYLHKLDIAFINVRDIIYPKPEGKAETISINPNAVTYIGDWRIPYIRKGRSLRWPISSEFSQETIIYYAEKYPEIVCLPLYIAAGNGKLYKMSWTDLSPNYICNSH